MTFSEIIHNSVCVWFSYRQMNAQETDDHLRKVKEARLWGLVLSNCLVTGWRLGAGASDADRIAGQKVALLDWILPLDCKLSSAPSITSSDL
jgi:hypothetical protein